MAVAQEFTLVSPFALAGDQPKATDALARGVRAGRPRPNAARSYRERQDDGDGSDDRTGQEADARPLPQQDARRAALRRVPRVLSATTRSSISSRTSIITSPKHTCRPPTRTSRRTARSTTRSSASATRRRNRCSPGPTRSSSPPSRASSAWDRLRTTWRCRRGCAPAT